MAKMCAATNVKGKPCGNRAQPGSVTCRVHQSADPAVVTGMEAESAKVRASRWTPVREWGAFVVAGLALLVGGFNAYQGHQNAVKDREIEATRLLDQAWDLLGGKPGTETITDFVKDRSAQEQARRLIRDALRIAPNLAAAHRLEGLYFKAQGEFEEAEASFRQALELDPDHAVVYNNLGTILRDQGRLDEAEPGFHRAIEFTHSNSGSTSASVLNNLGTLVTRDQDHIDQAEESFRRAIEIDPGYAKAHTNLGLTLADQGRHNEAEASYRRALEIDPDNAKAQRSLSLLLEAKTKDYDEGE